MDEAKAIEFVRHLRDLIDARIDQKAPAFDPDDSMAGFSGMSEETEATDALIRMLQE